MDAGATSVEQIIIGLGCLVFVAFIVPRLHPRRRTVSYACGIVIGGFNLIAGTKTLLDERSLGTSDKTIINSTADAQEAAVHRYPDLAVKGSELNEIFLARYKVYQATRLEYFSVQDWPIRLAKESAAAVRQ